MVSAWQALSHYKKESLTYSQLDPEEQTSMKFETIFASFLWGKCNWQFRLSTILLMGQWATFVSSCNSQHKATDDQSAAKTYIIFIFSLADGYIRHVFTHNTKSGDTLILQQTLGAHYFCANIYHHWLLTWSKVILMSSCKQNSIINHCIHLVASA